MNYEVLAILLSSILVGLMAICAALMTCYIKQQRTVTPESLAQAQDYIWRLTDAFNGKYNFDYLARYLARHLAKYPDGKLPPQAATIIYDNKEVKYTLNFFNAQDDRIVKYIKPCIRLLREPKAKKTRVNVIKQAEKIVKQRQIKTVGAMA